MTIICDTREKKNGHVLAWFERCGVPYKIQKMDVADYQIEGRDKLVIDRKQNLGELCKNLFYTGKKKDKNGEPTGKSERERFWSEIRKAREGKIKLIVLCEHGGRIKSIPDIATWSSKYTKVTGRALMEKVHRVHTAYGVEFLFCDKRSTGRRIYEILTGWSADD